MSDKDSVTHQTQVPPNNQMSVISEDERPPYHRPDCPAASTTVEAECQCEYARSCHELKTWPLYFEALWSGVKTFELRKNDRDFRKGDVLVLREWDILTSYTGRSVEAEVGYMIFGGQLGLEEGYCILGLSRPQRFPT